MSSTLKFKWTETIELIKSEIAMVARMKEDLALLAHKPKPQSISKPSRDL